MRLLPVLRMGVPVAALCWCLGAQTPPSQSQPAPAKAAGIEIKGMPPRPTPADYPDQTDAGKLTIAAEFQGHAVPTAQGNLTTEDYVTLEVAFYGPPGARVKLSFEDFSLRINGKKSVPGQPYGVVLGNVKDPEWIPPEPEKIKGHANLITGDPKEEEPKGEAKMPVFPPRMPIELQRAMNLRVQRAALPEGDRAVPIAGLIFFPYSGKTEKIRTLELVYAGSAGKAILTVDR